MADLVFTAITSLDGYVVDTDGSFEWAAPDEEVHAFVNDLERDVGTYLFGRRMYEVMSYWADPPADSDPIELDYAQVWQAADKVVYSRTLAAVSTPRTRLERELDLAAVRRLVTEAEQNVSISGPTLASSALRAGLVDEVQLFLNPVVVGGGTAALPDNMRLDLELVDQRRFRGGVVYLRYRRRG
jgi:dihydrofolate reductase